MNAMRFRSASTRRASSAAQSKIAIGRVLAEIRGPDHLVHADPALRAARPVREALSHQRRLERNPEQYVTPHAQRAALVTSTADLGTNRLFVFSAARPAGVSLTAIQEAAGPTQAFGAGGEREMMRAADADRDRVVERLNVAYSEGRLSKDEHDGRLENALSARTYGDLDQLVIDLPATAAAAVTPVAKTNELALVSLICGLAPFIFGPLPAIPAIVFGHLARHQIKRTGEQGGGLALAGLILGWATVILTIVLIVAMSVGMHGTTQTH
jgi:hypothetical protein